MSLDISHYRYLGQMQTEQQSRTAKDSSSVSSILSELQNIESIDGPGTIGTQEILSVFSAVLKEALERQTSSGELSSALSGASALGVTADRESLSDMMESEGGRQAIVAMADQNLTSYVFGMGNNDSSSVLNSLYQTNSSGTDQFTEILSDLLEIIGNTGKTEA